MESQARMILAFLQSGGVIEPLTAWTRFRCYRLSARIHELRAMGFKIATSMEEYTDTDGTKKRFAKYWLKAEDRA